MAMDDPELTPVKWQCIYTHCMDIIYPKRDRTEQV